MTWRLASSQCGSSQKRSLAIAPIVYAVLTILSAAFGVCGVAAQTPGFQQAAPFSASTPFDRRLAVEQVLKHIYAIYLGLRACTEISAMQNDRSFRPEVSLDESRQVLRQVDAATREIGINSAQIWDAEAPVALITAEALKTRPETHLVFCQKMGSIFRVDAGNLQAVLAQAGAKTPIITKDY